jgi:hypothetical protein
MEFVQLKLMPTKRYAYNDASNIEMNLLGRFLSTDVGCSKRGSPTYVEWAFQDTWGTSFCGNAICVEREGDFIFLSDVFPEKENPTKLKMPRQQFVDVIDEWFDKVCKHRPGEVVIKHVNDQFFIETQG